MAFRLRSLAVDLMCEHRMTYVRRSLDTETHDRFCSYYITLIHPIMQDLSGFTVGENVYINISNMMRTWGRGISLITHLKSTATRFLGIRVATCNVVTISLDEHEFICGSVGTEMLIAIKTGTNSYEYWVGDNRGVHTNFMPITMTVREIPSLCMSYVEALNSILVLDEQLNISLLNEEEDLPDLIPFTRSSPIRLTPSPSPTSTTLLATTTTRFFPDTDLAPSRSAMSIRRNLSHQLLGKRADIPYTHIRTLADVNALTMRIQSRVTLPEDAPFPLPYEKPTSLPVAQDGLPIASDILKESTPEEIVKLLPKATSVPSILELLPK